MIKQPSASLPQSSNVAQQPATRIQHTNPIPPVSPMSEAQQVLVPPTTPVINPISQPGISHPGITYANLNVPSTPRLMPAPEGTPSIPNTIVSTRQDNYQQKSWRRALATFKTSPSHRIIIILIVLLFLLPGVIAVITSNHLQQIDQEQHTTATAKAMVLTATATASNPTAVAIRATAQTMASNPYPAYLNKPLADHGNLALFDPLNQPGEWQPQQDTAFGGSCAYKNGVLDTTQSQSGSAYTCYGQTNFSDFAVEVQMKIIRGNCGGIVFHNNGANHEYMFEVCQNGTYNLYNYSTTTNPKTLLHSTSPYLHSELNQVNTIAVKAQGDTLRLYINQQLIDSATDNSQASGLIGFVASSTTHPTEVAYTRARIWTFTK